MRKTDAFELRHATPMHQQSCSTVKEKMMHYVAKKSVYLCLGVLHFLKQDLAQAIISDRTSLIS